MQTFDAIVIGSGPGGYVAAIKLAQLGRKVALVEKESSLGGTCLNVGCIPTKALIHSSELYDRMAHLADHGIVVDGYRFDMARMHKRKNKIVKTLTGGIGYLMKTNGVTVFRGTGAFADPHTVTVTPADGPIQTLRADHIVIATGSIPRGLPHLPFDHQHILDSTDMLRLETPPTSLAVIGAGAVGVEFASIYAFLGSAVTLIEMLPRLLPIEDEEVSAELAQAFRKRKITTHLGAAVEGAEVEPAGVTLTIRDAGGQTRRETFAQVLLAVGRAPYTDGLGLEKAGLELERGFIPVDPHCRTRVPHIFAIGDVIATPQLAHLASAEALTAAAVIAGQEARPINLRSVPSCTYSHPQVGSVGLTEAKARELGHPVKVGRFPFPVVGKAKIEGVSEGFVKIVTDERHGEILGVHMIGAIATELVAGMVLAMNLECTAEELAAAIHPHPTLSEAVMEAAHAAHDRAIHV